MLKELVVALLHLILRLQHLLQRRQRDSPTASPVGFSLHPLVEPDQQLVASFLSLLGIEPTSKRIRDMTRSHLIPDHTSP
ncbi:unnamed protein product [Linum trigynum]|uniref:Uncharacterized protein n=1 Tax=Linum trigynum TaxID=586398 RepID=A0AAV2D5V6_9ROSI